MFKGISSPLVGVAAVNAFLFGVYGNTLAYLESKFSSVEASPSLNNVFLAGAASGLLNSFISAPMEFTKIIAQDNATAKISPWTIFMERYKSCGIKGCYIGMIPTLCRETPSYAVYFASYEYLCRFFSPSGLSEDASYTSLMLAGGISGALGWTSTYPADVVKTVIQSQNFKTQEEFTRRKYRGILQTTYEISKLFGWKALFKGLDATLIRAFPTNAVIFWAYSITMSRLSELE